MLTSLKTEKLKKWLNARKGRTLLLAEMLDMTKSQFYKLVFEHRISKELLNTVEYKQKEIEKLEVRCIEKFKYLKRFAGRGGGRVPRLAKALNEKPHSVRNLVKATGDSRYLMIGFGIDRVLRAMVQVDREYQHYNPRTIDFKSRFTPQMRRSSYTLSGIETLAGKIKEGANYGDHDSAIIFRRIADNKYRVLSIGFDCLVEDMCKSHICDKGNPYMHALTIATLSLPRSDIKDVGEISVFVNTAPCPVCAERILNSGISRVYCHFEPELMGGLIKLAEKNIPVLKINIADRSIKAINKHLFTDAA